MTSCIDCNIDYTNEKKTIINSFSHLLPLEICEKIMTYYKPSTKCSRCNTILCYNHGILEHQNYDFRTLFYYGKYKYLCEDCSYKLWDNYNLYFTNLFLK